MAQEIADSKLIDTWGSSGTKIEPDISKIIEGWQLGEQPPHEYMNWLQNTFGSKLNHILKNGVASWNNETQYLAGSSVQHSGNVWICEITNINSEPTDLNANWGKVAINKDLTVPVDTLADLRNINYPSSTVWVSGYHTKNDGAFGSHIFRLKGVKTTETDNGGTVIVATIDGVDYVYELQYDGAVNVKWFGAKGDDITDDTIAIQAAVNVGIAANKTVYAPEGVFLYSSLDNIKASNFKFHGAGSDKTYLKYTGTGTALSLDAFIDGGKFDPYVNNVSLSAFSIIGATLTIGLFMQGIARSKFKDIKVNGSNGVEGTVGFELRGVQLSHFEDMYSSSTFGDVPYRGFFLRPGTRFSLNVGACSNNIFISTYSEGNAIGIQFASNGGDQNLFLGGASQRCSVYGLLVSILCRYNTFIGLGFENLGITNHDINESGEYSRYINCYSSEKTNIAALAKGTEISGGFFERIEIVSGAKGTTINDVTVNNWATGTGGFINNGEGTRWRNVYDKDLATYIHKQRPRTTITVGDSPFLYTNADEIPLKILVRGGMVTEILFYRDGDFWVEPKPTDSGEATVTTGIYILMPGDKIRVSYSSVPSMNKIPMAGF